jgi:hypothetical protein
MSEGEGGGGEGEREEERGEVRYRDEVIDVLRTSTFCGENEEVW